MLHNVKHIIFDLGGVLLNLDFTAAEKAFEAIGIPEYKSLFSKLQQATFFDDFDTGKISKEEFKDHLCRIADVHISDDQFWAAWNAMLLDFPLRRLQLLQQLRLHYDLFLLSNTNEVHEAAFNNILMQTHSIPNIGVFFDKVYLSHRVGLRKPGKEIFLLILGENGLQAEQTLFIDDSPQHIATAKELGIQTIHLDKGMTIEEHIFKPKE